MKKWITDHPVISLVILYLFFNMFFGGSLSTLILTAIILALVYFLVIRKNGAPSAEQDTGIPAEPGFCTYELLFPEMTGPVDFEENILDPFFTTCKQCGLFLAEEPEIDDSGNPCTCAFRLRNGGKGSIRYQRDARSGRYSIALPEGAGPEEETAAREVLKHTRTALRQLNGGSLQVSLRENGKEWGLPEKPRKSYM